MRYDSGRDSMLVNRKTIRVEWGDCDPVGIVYYPRYFFFFDNCTAALFERAGLQKREMIKRYKIAGIPMVKIEVHFRKPSRFGEDVVVESSITAWRNSSFDVRHRLYNGEDLAVECFETRVWAAPSGKEPGRIKKQPVPREVKARFS